MASDGEDGSDEWPVECSDVSDGDGDSECNSRGEEPERSEAKIEEPVENVEWCVG